LAELLLPCTHAWRIRTGEVDALVAFTHFKNSLARAPAATHSWHCTKKRVAAGPKVGKVGGIAAPMCMSILLNHQAGGDHHIQLTQPCGSPSVHLGVCSTDLRRYTST
jgi:hypothetical protein